MKCWLFEPWFDSYQDFYRLVLQQMCGWVCACEVVSKMDIVR